VAGAGFAPRAAQPITFRVHAPGAHTVLLVGDFNGWSEPGELLRPLGDGWWELRRALPVGSWQYAYVIDGRWAPPRDAAATVDDGFGGRNGVLVVLP
jgi:1,4-alpha-glucan branching enzyme